MIDLRDRGLTRSIFLRGVSHLFPGHSPDCQNSADQSGNAELLFINNNNCHHSQTMSEEGVAMKKRKKWIAKNILL
jgi:hypothetical protein